MEKIKHTNAKIKLGITDKVSGTGSFLKFNSRGVLTSIDGNVYVKRPNQYKR